MSAWAPVFRLAQRSLIMLAVIVVLCGAAVYGFGLFSTNLQQSFSAQQGSLQSQQAMLELHQADLSNMRTHIKAYETLRAQGLVGQADRAQWVEQLQASFERLGLPGRIVVQLQAAKPLNTSDVTADAANPSGTPVVPLSHDLQFEIHEVHEEELLALLQDFRDNVKARFRIDSCQMRDASETGLTALCTLRFVTIPANMAAPSPAPAGAQ